jgi:hypothetical protein
MAISFRMLSPCSLLPGKGPQYMTTIAPTCTVSGKLFDNSVPGVIYDAPSYEFASQLRGFGWTPLGVFGTTADRPTQGLNGPPITNFAKDFFDTTVGKHIFWDGLVWRDPFTGAIA